MAWNFSSILYTLWPQVYIPAIGCSVSLGLISGMVLALTSGDSFLSLMRVVPLDHVSIVSLSFVLCFPFLLCFLAVSLSISWLLPIICFAKSLSFSCISLGMLTAFGGAGWLIRTLMMFGHILTFPLLICFCLRHGSGSKRGFFNSVSTIAAVLALIIATDRYFISHILG